MNVIYKKIIETKNPISMMKDFMIVNSMGRGSQFRYIIPTFAIKQIIASIGLDNTF